MNRLNNKLTNSITDRRKQRNYLITEKKRIELTKMTCKL